MSISSERVLGALAEPDERDVRSLSGGHGADVFDLDLARDHLVSERDHDRGDEREAVLALVGDQDAQMVGAVGQRLHKPILKSGRHLTQTVSQTRASGVRSTSACLNLRRERLSGSSARPA